MVSGFELPLEFSSSANSASPIAKSPIAMTAKPRPLSSN